MPLQIASYVPLSLCDFPSLPAAVVFTQGCNLACPWCHNKHLIPTAVTADLGEATVFHDLVADVATGLIEGVVISGGEPTIQADALIHFCDTVKTRLPQLKIKLDTNGTNPAVVAELISQKWVDYVAMDLKAPWHCYPARTGCSEGNVLAMKLCKQLLQDTGIAHEFRVTKYPELTADDIVEISHIAGPSRVRWQNYRLP